MSIIMSRHFATQNDLLLKNLLSFYRSGDHLEKMLRIISGESRISLRIVDWFSTNFAKKHYTQYPIDASSYRRFKVYDDYKLKLKAYSKRRFDPFCRWERIQIPYTKPCTGGTNVDTMEEESQQFVETTIGQLNFFKWAIENKVIDYIEDHYEAIEGDMNCRNSTSKRKEVITDISPLMCGNAQSKTRKKREELSISATKSIKKEKVEIVVQFR